MKWLDDLQTDNGYRVQDLNQTRTFALADSLCIQYLDSGTQPQRVALADFEPYLARQNQQTLPGVYWVYVKDNQVVVIIEQYRP